MGIIPCCQKGQVWWFRVLLQLGIGARTPWRALRGYFFDFMSNILKNELEGFYFQEYK
jgi:hypothetical protein